MSEGRLEIEGLVAGYVRGLPIVFDLSLHATAGEVVTVIGPNGAGKSTLIKAIAGLLPIESGSIRFAGRSLVGIRADRLAQHAVSYVPQTANVFQQLSVEQNLVLSAQRLPGERAGRIAAMYELFPVLADKRRRKAGTLSGGQRQMLAIAMALVARPRLVLMDEPTAGLSPKAAQAVFALIRSIAADGVCVLLVEQNARAALAISERAYVLAEGRNQLDGPAHELLHDPVVGEIYLGARRFATPGADR